MSTTEAPIRFPTPAEFEAMWLAQCADEATRARQATPRPQTEAEAELIADGARLDPATSPTPRLCPVCGLRFSYKTDGMARMQRARHLKRQHPESVAV